MIIETLVEVMNTEGPQLHTHSVPKQVVKEADGSLTLHLENGQTYNVDTLIWAIGRHPATDAINLAATALQPMSKATSRSMSSKTLTLQAFTVWVTSWKVALS